MSKYTKDHEWALVNGNIATVGISIHAQGSLGDLVYVELPEVGKEVMQGDEIAVVESVKAASDVYSPLSGKIVEVNTKLEDSPELVNQSAELDGWIWKMEVANADELKALMSSEEYQAFIAE
ncbi:MAG: glycine cleavage system protein GcvH [Alphaproteobacteria bacterium]|nr:glycine cleavage system protein GcvH [Alphaproteobacteria bacterium]